MRLLDVATPPADGSPPAGPGLPGAQDLKVRRTRAGLKEFKMEQKLKIAVFIDFDNIEIGVKSTLHREFDVAAVLDALKERGKSSPSSLTPTGEGRIPPRALFPSTPCRWSSATPRRGDKNGADINLALDALEMAFTHDHINASPSSAAIATSSRWSTS